MIMRYFCRIVCFLWFVWSGLPAQAQTKNDSLKQLFRDAKTELQAMLEGRLPLNFSRAVFLHENAYLGGTLNYEAFLQDIRFRTEIVKRIAAIRPTQGYKKADSLQVQLQASIFKLLTDTTKIRFADEQENGRTGAEVTSFILPARYAWEDFAGQKNWEVMFVSRLMQTNEGNCHSLPYLYKLIADELRVPAWLSSAPHHLYIQGYSQETGLFNTELSSATFPKDSWLMASGYVGKDAIRNRVYMDTLTLKQSISLCLVDLAQGYQRKFEDTGFVLSCLRTAQVAHPKGLSAFLAEIQTLSKVYQTTKQEMDYKRLETLASKVCMLGYQEIPRAEYVRWLANPHTPRNAIEGEAQTEGKFSTSPLPTFELNTLSGGKYAEYADLTQPRRIGSLLYSPKTGKILHFVAPDTVAVPVEVSARFLSVDPLTKSYPELTPYQFAGDNPIRYIDLDGLEKASPKEFEYAEISIGLSRKGDDNNHPAIIDAGNAGMENDNNTYSPHIPNISRKQYLDGLQSLVQNPQGCESAGWSCGPTAISYTYLNYDPQAFVTACISLYDKGFWISPSGKKIEVNDDIRQTVAKEADVEKQFKSTSFKYFVLSLRASENKDGKMAPESGKYQGSRPWTMRNMINTLGLTYSEKRNESTFDFVNNNAKNSFFTIYLDNYGVHHYGDKSNGLFDRVFGIHYLVFTEPILKVSKDVQGQYWTHRSERTPAQGDYNQLDVKAKIFERSWKMILYKIAKSPAKN
jgi:hypothetical protein